MQTNVSTLLREFPKVRKRALAGETVVIHTREGNLLLMAEHSPHQNLWGCLKGKLKDLDHDLSSPTLLDEEWKASL
jgi:hypothetical protein